RPEQATNRIPVKVKGVVTFVDTGRTVFIQDETGGTFLRGGVLKSPPAPGSEIEVEGTTYPGLFIPGIDSKTVRVLGTAPYPRPRSVDYDDLDSGRYNYEWVQVRGVVRSMSTSTDAVTVVRLALGRGRLDAHVAAGTAPADLQVGARVAIEGLAAGFINDKRQLVSPHLRVRDFGSVIVEAPATLDAFSLPLTAAQTLLRFSPDKEAGDPVRIKGVVLHYMRGSSLFLRDGVQGIYVQTSQVGLLNPGDVVEAVGFPSMGSFSAMLEDARFQRIGPGPIPSTVSTDARRLMTGAHDGDLVRVEASLLEVLRGSEDLTLLLQSSNVLFKARLPLSADIGWAAGSRLALSGICRVEAVQSSAAGFRSNPRSFELWLRSPSDVFVLDPPPWWTQEKLTLAVSVLLVGVLLTLVWVGQLRARVQAQTAIIREKIQAEATTEERRRIAREFHDTLEQELVGLSLRLDAAAVKVEDPKGRDLLDVARRLAQRLQIEAREFVWNLREKHGTSDLGAALSESVERMRPATGPDVRLTISGGPKPLPAGTEHHLLRLAQEAVSNALKHAQAKLIRVELAYSPERVTLTVSDDGIGFDTGIHTAAPGHFGLLGMQERVKKMGGVFEFKSRPGAGTQVMVTVKSTDQAAPAVRG
ncbi:MAG TPA: sensor histidine kinase, partial [Roseimicrobium sp.]|nr:sensor histidine kinase [Roseimicrobium sp.]